ncbi:hypothetical protein Pcinc_041594 [Petrolisthes cinctipes]|uniref:AB hydrolase-1 domain-containing protein n=1 Tax=Petrolisthes cinctipes TaxID=88211 RepID=A0AAE1EHN6_PETCI|nr:hypothetical protein Pcinc_041594 [Petrolisthes cinctipes]
MSFVFWSGLMLKRLSSGCFVQGKTLCTQNIYTGRPKMYELEEAKEIKIPIPSGHIDGKVWNEGGTPILGLHGFMDNASTWDTLAPLLPQSHSLISIDFPGHGLSSRYPVGGFGHLISNVIVVERVMQHFGWNEVNILGHSMGAGIGLLYAGTFPEKVKKLAMIDLIKPMSTSAADQPGRTALGISDLIKAESRLDSNPPSYEYDVIVDKMVKSYGNSLTEESAKILLKRGSVRQPDGSYSFSYDPRLKTRGVLGMTIEQMKEYGKRLECELMILKASLGPVYEQQEIYDEFLNVYKKKAEKFMYHTVEGTHHIHLNNPELIAPLLNKFFGNKVNNL